MSKFRLPGPLIAVTLLVAAGAWLFSGQLVADDSDQNQASSSAPEKSLIARVQTVVSEAQTVTPSLTINGVTEAARKITVRSEANGKILQLNVKQGDSVNANAVLIKIDEQDLPARLRQAQALRFKPNSEYEGAQKLKRQGLQNEAQVAAAKANYEQAKAQLAGLELQLTNTLVKAPFAGQLDSLHVEFGSFVRSGDAIAELYDFSSLVFSGSVSEKDVSSLSIGQRATVQLLDLPPSEATISYIGSVANPATRTFTVEMRIKNAPRLISGVTSTATVALPPVVGHYVSPALLIINSAGDMGLKVITENNQVQFMKTDIIRSDTQGVWLAGLPEAAEIIVVGQGFVNPGETVEVTQQPYQADTAVGL